MNQATRRHYKKVKFRSLDQPDCCWNCNHFALGYEGELTCELMTDINVEKWRRYNKKEEETGRDDLPLPQNMDESVGPLDICDKYERYKQKEKVSK